MPLLMTFASQRSEVKTEERPGNQALIVMLLSDVYITSMVG
jgi:hypothetical protein